MSKIKFIYFIAVFFFLFFLIPQTAKADTCIQIAYSILQGSGNTYLPDACTANRMSSGCNQVVSNGQFTGNDCCTNRLNISYDYCKTDVVAACSASVNPQTCPVTRVNSTSVYCCTLPTPTPTPSGLVPTQQLQCNPQGTGWNTVPLTQACVLPSQCTVIPPTPTPVPPTLTPTPVCSFISTPAGLSPSGTITTGTHTLTWNAQPGASYYSIRIDDPANGGLNCNSGGDICADITTNSYLYTFTANKTYAWWVHARNSCGQWSPSAGTAVTVISPPTPTPVPPTPTPTPVLACSYSDSDGQGWPETCVGVGGPISDTCNTSTSYRYANCDTSIGCSYSSTITSCPAGQLCKLQSNGKPECYIPPPTPTPTPFGGNGQPCSPSRTCNPGLQCAGDGFCESIPPTATPTPTPTLTPTVTIQGHHVNSLGNDLVLTGQRVTLNTGAFDTRTPFWFFNTLSPGTYAATASLIAGYNISYSLCVNCTTHTTYTPGNSVSNINLPIGGNYADIFFKYTPIPTSTPTPTITPTPTRTPTPTPTPTPVVYSISGKVFNDVNGDEKSVAVPPAPADSNYTGAVTITRSPASGSFSNSGGNYSFTNLPAGQYTITFSGLPQGFVFTYPDTPLTVRVGLGCFFPITSEASCPGNSIINLNAGVTNLEDAWFQSIGSDMRWETSLPYPEPPSGESASLDGIGGSPGIMFLGTNASALTSQPVSSKNWKVAGNNQSISNRDVFTDTHNLIPTSYRFLLETAQGSGITPTTISSIDSSLTHGMYKTNGDITINAPVTFGSGDFIILINGNLTINQKIKVPVGSTAIFSATGNITVNRGIGEIASSTISTIEGLYSADRNFVADGNNDCSLAIDLRLNVAGSVIANAGRSNGTFVNNRDLCAGNSFYPSVSFIERSDFILNYPSLTQQTTRAWRDVAP